MYAKSDTVDEMEDHLLRVGREERVAQNRGEIPENEERRSSCVSW